MTSMQKGANMTGIIHMTCLCGEKHDISPEDKINCKCGRIIDGRSLNFGTIPADRNITLTEYTDTGRHDIDLFGYEGNKPIYRNFEFHMEYSEDQWDNCETHYVAVNLSDPVIRFSHGSSKKLFELIDKYWDEA